MIIGLAVIILAVIYFIYSVTIGIEWCTHKDMVKTCTSAYGYGTYEDFKREFAKIDWKHNAMFTNSLFDHSNDSKCHASIIQFNGKGMIIKDPFSYLQVRMLIRQAVIDVQNKNLVDWSDKSQNLEVSKIDLQKKIR